MKARIVLVDGKPQVEVLDDAGKALAKVEPELPEGYAIEDVSKLRSALEAKKHLIGEASKKLRLYGWTVKDDDSLAEAQGGAIDPAEARKALATVAAGPPPKDNAEIERRWQQKHDAEIAAKDAAIAAEKAKVQRHLQRAVEGEVRTAIANHKGLAPDILSSFIMQRVKVEETETGDPKVVVTDQAGRVLVTKKANTADPMQVDEFVQSLKSDAKHASFFEGSGTGGSGATGTHGGSARTGTSNGPLSSMDLLTRANSR